MQCCSSDIEIFLGVLAIEKEPNDGVETATPCVALGFITTGSHFASFTLETASARFRGHAGSTAFRLDLDHRVSPGLREHLDAGPDERIGGCIGTALYQPATVGHQDASSFQHHCLA